MLTRRQLRIKVLQCLYAYYQGESQDTLKGEKELLFSIDKIYDLYLSYLLLFDELRHQAELKIEEGKQKLLPSEKDLNPSTRFINNPVLKAIATSAELHSEIQKRKISWLTDMDIVKKIFQDIYQSDYFKSYLTSQEGNFAEDKNFVSYIFKEFIANNDSMLALLEEKSVYWQDDIDMVCSAILKNISALDQPHSNFKMTPLWKNKEEDLQFTKELFIKSILKKEETDTIVKSKTENWELERIAQMDLIIMNMAITEAIEFPSIPVKVSLNEYIDLSKEYSTPRSHIFVNGILDKSFAQLRAEGKIKKTGRGLIE